jgi:hypothetical protein
LIWLPFGLGLSGGSPSRGGEPVDVTSTQKAIKSYRETLAKKQDYLRNLINAEKERRGPCVETLTNIQARESDMKPVLDALNHELARLSEQLKPVIDVAKEVQSREKEKKNLDAQIQQARKELTGLEREKTKLSEELDGASKSLEAIQRQSKEKIADWMLKKYEKHVVTSEPITTLTQKVQDVHTLFGAYTIVSPRKLEAGKKDETIVRFTPAIFTKDLFPVSIKTGPVATSVPVPQGLEFTPGEVFGAFGARAFELSEKDLVEIDPPSSIIWNWATNATDQFGGAKFQIQMQAKLEQAKESKKASLDLPVEIEWDPGKSFIEKFQGLIGTALGCGWSLIVALISVVGGGFLGHILTLRREKP